MPKKDGTGPDGMGAGTGRGMGKSSGGRGRNSGGACGPQGMCICAKCGARSVHQQGIPCTKLKCPDCGQTMIREELLNARKKDKE